MKELYQLARKKGVLRSAAIAFIYTAMLGIMNKPCIGFTTHEWLFRVLVVSLGLSALTMIVMMAIVKSEDKRQRPSS